MANRGKMRQIEDVKRSKIVVEIGVFYYRCPFVTLGDLECRWFESGRQMEVVCLVPLECRWRLSRGTSAAIF